MIFDRSLSVECCGLGADKMCENLKSPIPGTLYNLKQLFAMNLLCKTGMYGGQLAISAVRALSPNNQLINQFFPNLQ